MDSKFGKVGNKKICKTAKGAMNDAAKREHTTRPEASKIDKQ